MNNSNRFTATLENFIPDENGFYTIDTYIEDEIDSFTVNDFDDYHSYDGKPAVIYKSKITEHYFHGTLHNENGPAVTYPDGNVEYWLAGQKYTKGQFNRLSKLDRTETLAKKIVDEYLINYM